VTRWLQLADDVALLQFPFRAFGIDFARNVTLLRLRDGRLVIHSTAPFAPADIEAITDFGAPGWLVEATVLHDTFAKAGREAFPAIPYLAPSGFAKVARLTTTTLSPKPAEWKDEIDVLEIDGLHWPNEHAFYHRASGTLVLADLLFHFPPRTRGWARFFIRQIMRLPRLVGISVFFRFMIRDREAFARSMRTMLEWDFKRIVVAHRTPIVQDAKAIFRQALLERNIIGRV
jgi:hypothetical protein